MIYASKRGDWVRAHVENPILAEFRRSAPFDVIQAASFEFGWLGAGSRPVPAEATPAEIDHALRVFWRLVRICGNRGSDD